MFMNNLLFIIWINEGAGSTDNKEETDNPINCLLFNTHAHCITVTLHAGLT
jgi:hypothetical protein